MKKELRQNNEKVKPAIIVAPQIGTPDNKLFKVTDPFTDYENIVDYYEHIDTENYMFSFIPNNIFFNKLSSVLKMLCITAFNLVNNPIGNEDTRLENINGISVYDYEGSMTTKEPSRHPEELFTNRKTLDIVLNEIDNYIIRQFNVYKGIEMAYINEYAYYVLSCIYNICLNRIDCEKDVVNFNRFMNNLICTVPYTFMQLGKEYNKIYKDHVTVKNNDQMIESE